MPVHAPPPTPPPSPDPGLWARTTAAAREQWARHGGIDGGIRVGGALAVVVTIEALAGYYLWVGMTTQVGVPDTLGWTLQAGLGGGSAVGTRAFHRGLAEDKWWGFAASVLAMACLVTDASLFALLTHGQVAIPAGTLAVVALVECLAVGYLTVHTLMAAPRRAPAAATAAESAAEQQPAEFPEVEFPEVEFPEVEFPEVEPEKEPEDEPEDEPEVGGPEDEPEVGADEAGHDDPDHRLIPWHALTKDQAQAEARRLTARGRRVTQSRKTLEQLRLDVRDARRLLGEEPVA